MNNRIKICLETVAIIVATFCGIVTSANALNHAYAEHEGLVTACACVTLVITLVACWFAIKNAMGKL